MFWSADDEGLGLLQADVSEGARHGQPHPRAPLPLRGRVPGDPPDAGDLLHEAARLLDALALVPAAGAVILAQPHRAPPPAQQRPAVPEVRHVHRQVARARAAEQRHQSGGAGVDLLPLRQLKETFVHLLEGLIEGALHDDGRAGRRRARRGAPEGGAERALLLDERLRDAPVQVLLQVVRALHAPVAVKKAEVRPQVRELFCQMAVLQGRLAPLPRLRVYVEVVVQRGAIGAANFDSTELTLLINSPRETNSSACSEALIPCTNDVVPILHRELVFLA
mmetsp:Transcript_16554/g.35999  ORF Transcript_16554/g.35999 Transcript_16554/m.35999 type:complete len:279 (-) Transcript_16554:451-1287(-)